MQTTLGTPTASAVIFFLVIVALTLAVTYWAARRTRSTREFYAAGRSISPLQNGLALAGDYMSAASFLGIAGLVALRGYDGMIYATGWLVGWPALMFLIAEPLRNLGKFTFADVVAFRLRQVPVRIASAFGGDPDAALLRARADGRRRQPDSADVRHAVRVGGGERRRRDACLRALRRDDRDDVGADHQGHPAAVRRDAADGAGALAQFHFSPGALYAAVAARYGQAALEPGGLVSDPIDAISLGLALMLGLLGLPHILMRFYTVPDARAARAIGALRDRIHRLLLSDHSDRRVSAPRRWSAATLIRSIDAGGNMAAPLVAELLGGTPFLGFIAAVAFATILAVVAGPDACRRERAVARHLHARHPRRGRRPSTSRSASRAIATVVFGVVAVSLGILFKGQNVAFMVGLAFAVACSANFPPLLLSIVWRRFNTAGAVCSIVSGALLSVTLIVLSPTVWVDLLHNPTAIFPLRNPAIVSMPVSFLCGVIASLLTREPEAECVSTTRSCGPISASAQSSQPARRLGRNKI